MKLRIARQWAATSLVALSLATLTAVPAQAATDGHSSTMAEAPAPAPVSELVDAVSIPYEQFKLANGLTVLVHTDRSAPVVAVSVWYGVGSKNEPKGKTGFAHLFEHLMFNGSEHSPGDFFEPLQQVGATDFNGTTWFDRTNYFETVPSAALDTALFLESDRMGYLLGAVTQEKLDNQIGVVQNEKRQGDNQPYGLVEYEQLENLYPVGHPYHHSTIGSMKDLSGATLADVKGWFTDHYGPNNAILVLAGDVDLATAKQKVTKWFGAIPAGPKVAPVRAPVPTLPAPLAKTIYDKVATPRVYRMWAMPGLDNPDYIPLSMGATVLGGLASSRLDNALVRQQKVAVSVAASADIFAQAGQFVVYADAKPGVSEEELGKALDAEIAKFLAEGPTADELQRATTVYAAGQIRGLDSLGGFNGKAPTLAEGLLYNGDPKHYKTELETAAAMTPAKVKAVTAEYLSRPAFALTVAPGTRKQGGEDRGGWGAAPVAMTDGKSAPARHPAYYMAPGSDAGPGAFATAAERAKVPEIGTIKPLAFPRIERATLANGMQVYFARRDSVPTVSVKIDFDAGYAADPRDKLGLQSLMLRAMNEGTTDLDSQQLAIAKERLGASLGGYASFDETSFGMDAVVPNLAASFDLLADYIRHPAFRADDLERARAQQLTRIQNELNDPRSIAQRALYPLVYGDHPYGIPPSGTGDAAVVEKLTTADLSAFHDKWLRPDRARIFVVGDTTLADVTKLLEASFGDWKNPEGPAPKKNFDAAIPTPTSRIILIDRPASPQSVIGAARVLPHKGTDDLLVLEAANEVFGGSFLSRFNMDLRETKGWSYGVRSMITDPQDRNAFLVYAPVQADRTGDSIVALRKDLDAYTTGGEGVTQEELVRLVNGNVRELPGRFATTGGVLNGIVDIVENKRPDNYFETLGAKYTALTAPQIDKAALADLKTGDLVYVVVGDAKVVEPQLKQLGLPVEVRKTDEASVDSDVSKGN